jgi:hypothetical protein
MQPGVEVLLDASNGQVLQLSTALQGARGELLEAMHALQQVHTKRVEQRTKRTHTMVEEGLDSGSRTQTTLGLLGLIADCHTLRNENDSGLHNLLTPYLRALDQLISAAAMQLGLPHPLKEEAYDGNAQRKRRRLLADALCPEVPRAQATVVAMLQDPERIGLGTALSAAEHRMLSTVIPESALLPDVAAMHDIYHPNVSLYDISRDRHWKDAARGCHLGFHASTMLTEFALLRGQMRRFTFAHLLPCMGFGASDINHYVTYLDDSFYRRVCTDTRVGFLAESFSPRVRLFRGQHGSALWDIFLGNRGDWEKRPRTGAVVSALLADLRNTPAQELVPGTVLGALHRRHGTRMQPYDSWPVMEELGELEAAFVSGARALSNAVLAPTLDAMRGSVRACPVCLRQLAVHHVKQLVCSLNILPRSPQVAEEATGRSAMSVADVTQWLWELVPRPPCPCPCGVRLLIRTVLQGMLMQETSTGHPRLGSSAATSQRK